MPNNNRTRTMKASVKKRKVYDDLPPKLRKPLKKPILKKLTFGDLYLIERQLEKRFQEDQGNYKISACGACGGWP